MGLWDRSLLPFACASPNKVWLELVLSTGACVYIYVGASSRYSDISIINSCQFDAPVDLLQGPMCLAQKKKPRLENYICLSPFFNYWTIFSNSWPTLPDSAARALLFWIIPTQPCVFLKCQEAAGKVAWTTAADAPLRLHWSRHSKSQRLWWKTHMLAADQNSHIAWSCTTSRRSFKDGLAQTVVFTAERSRDSTSKMASTAEWETNEPCHNSLKAKKGGKKIFVSITRRAHFFPIRRDKYLYVWMKYRVWPLSFVWCYLPRLSEQTGPRGDPPVRCGLHLPPW